MGKALGREWSFKNIRSARHALSMIEANTGKAFAWVRENLEKYANYRVICEFADGRKEELESKSYAEMMQRGIVTLRFVPLIAGASAVARVVVGVVMIVVGVIWQQPWAVQMGAAMALGGVAEMLSPKPNSKKASEEDSGKNSHYFNGAQNLSNQGAPVQLVYGRCKVGSQAVSAAITIDQLL